MNPLLPLLHISWPLRAGNCGLAYLGGQSRAIFLSFFEENA